MPRTILVHLSVDVPDDDDRTPPEIAEAIQGALDVGWDDDEVRDLAVFIPLVEEV